MNTTIQHETPTRVGTSTLNSDALKRLGTAAEDRSEKATINISEEAIENLKTKTRAENQN